MFPNKANFPAAVDTIAEENSSRVIQFGPRPLFDSVRHFIAKHNYLVSDPTGLHTFSNR